RGWHRRPPRRESLTKDASVSGSPNSVDAMASAAVTTERRDGVLICHIDDGKANALSEEIIAAIIDVLDDAEHDASVSAVVLHGHPGRFSAGFDLSVMRGDDVG